MSIGVWQPDRPETLTQEILEGLVSAAKDIDNVSEDVVQGYGFVMRLQSDAWQVAAELDSSTLASLIRFFTLAEAQFTGWEAGKTSPVIYLVKMLKQRSEFDAELRKWIKQNTDNRYLPYGAAL